MLNNHPGSSVRKSDLPRKGGKARHWRTRYPQTFPVTVTRIAR